MTKSRPNHETTGNDTNDPHYIPSTEINALLKTPLIVVHIRKL